MNMENIEVSQCQDKIETIEFLKNRVLKYKDKLTWRGFDSDGLLNSRGRLKLNPEDDFDAQTETMRLKVINDELVYIEEMISHLDQELEFAKDFREESKNFETIKGFYKGEGALYNDVEKVRMQRDSDIKKLKASQGNVRPVSAKLARKKYGEGNKDKFELYRTSIDRVKSESAVAIKAIKSGYRAKIWEKLEKLSKKPTRREKMDVMLRGIGAIPGISSLPLGGLLTMKWWIKLNKETGVKLYEELKERSDKIANELHLVGPFIDNVSKALTNSYDDQKGGAGCICISWVKIDGDTYAPIIGISGFFPKVITSEEGSVLKDNESIARHGCLPDFKNKFCKKVMEPNEEEYEPAGRVNRRDKIGMDVNNVKRSRSMGNKKDKRIEELNEGVDIENRIDADDREHFEWRKFVKVNRTNGNFELMRDNMYTLSLNNNVRWELGCRLASRQAMLSYVGWVVANDEGAGVSWHPDVSIESWHSFNCAEPAALIVASSLFVEGLDVVVCFPYEGRARSTTDKPRPKETCGWCASVELVFRSIRQNSDLGENYHVFTRMSGFGDEADKESGLVNLGKNLNTQDDAYPGVKLEKIKSVRKIMHAFELLEERHIKIG